MTVWAFCGSFCTLSEALSAAKSYGEKNELVCVVSKSVSTVDTRFGKSSDFIEEIKKISAGPVIDSIKEAEPIGPVLRPDVMIIAPCTGNTLAKMAAGITDTPVTMAAKAHLRNERPLIIALATNDALSANFKNIGSLMERKNIYFVPLGQDDPIKKPFSLVADYSLIEKTTEAALRGRQLQPFLLPR